MINTSATKNEHTIQSGVVDYPIGFPFYFNPDRTPQLLIKIGDEELRFNHNFELSEDKGSVVLRPTEEESWTLEGPEDFSWMTKWDGKDLLIKRAVPFIQDSDYQLGRISSEQIERDFDLSVMRDQILADKIGEHTEEVQVEIDALHSRIDFVQEEHLLDMVAVDKAMATKATKTELETAKAVLSGDIQSNTDAIQKTREDYIEADGEIHQILNSHASELTTLRGNQASLGDQVSGIEEKIPESASGSNPLITKQQLLDEEMDIREDLNGGLSELQTQITAQAAAIAGKQDELIAGDNIVISGNVISATGAGGGAGFDIQVIQELPATGQKGIIYLLAKDGAAPDVYDEYVWIETTQTFELIGTTQVDLTDYAKKEELDNYLPLTGGTLTGPLGFGGESDFGITGTTLPILRFNVTSPDGSVLEKTISVSPNRFIFFDGLDFNGVRGIHPVAGVNCNLGGPDETWNFLFAKKLRNGYGGVLNVPEDGGTLARTEDIDAIGGDGEAGQVLTKTDTGMMWQDATGGGGGIADVVHDGTLNGSGTDAAPLGVNTEVIATVDYVLNTVSDGASGIFDYLEDSILPEINTLKSDKQDKLTAGDGISISGNTISATGTGGTTVIIKRYS